jgi:DNA mismatch repair protein MutL
MRIRELEPAVFNQIAAGEVVERPASVVKELLENAADAQATHININIQSGGLNFIKVSDNGLGIDKLDLPLAIMAHATSKIQALDDLYQLQSLGFRGEALASIAAVSKLSIISKTFDDEGYILQDGKVEPHARQNGTSIEVRDLFYNAIVRKRFLKSPRLEYQAIETVVKQFALSANHINISLEHDGKTTLYLPKASCEHTRKQRLKQIFGKSFMDNALFLHAQYDNFELSGFISNKNYQRSQRDKQWLYVNNRYIKDSLIQNALRQNYQDLLHPGRFPSYILYLNLPQDLVDVNVHPTKNEVRFVSPMLIHDFVSKQIYKALGKEMDAREDKAVAATYYLKQQNIIEQSLWHPISEKLILIADNQENVYLVNIHKLFLYKHLSADITLPLKSRPLLTKMQINIADDFDLTMLNNFGITAEKTEKNILITEIPLEFPNLDLQKFLHDSHNKKSNHDLKTVFLESLQYDARYLSMEEQNTIKLMLLQCNNKQYAHNCGIVKIDENIDTEVLC